MFGNRKNEARKFASHTSETNFWRLADSETILEDTKVRPEAGEEFNAKDKAQRVWEI